MESGAHIGARIAQARRSAGLSQEQLARELDVTVGTISRLERGVTKDLTLGKLQRIAHVLDVQFSDLLEAAVA